MSMPTDIDIVDLGIGFPHTSIEQKTASYDFFRANLKDAESQREMEFPVQYIFKGVPDVVPDDTDVVEWVVEKMDAFNIRIARVGLSENGLEARRRYPDRFVLGMSVDPNDVLGAIRRIEAAKVEHDVVSAMVFPSGCVPQVAIDDRKMYPVYAKCVELGIPICVNGGIVGPRMPSWPQQVFRFDEVCYDFPDLTIVMMHGGEPWEDLAVKLMLKWPGLHYMTSAFAPKHYPEAIIDYDEHPRRRQDHVLRLLPGRAHPRAPVRRPAQRSVPRPRVAQVPAGEHAARLQDPRGDRTRDRRAVRLHAGALIRSRRLRQDRPRRGTPTRLTHSSLLEGPRTRVRRR